MFNKSKAFSSFSVDDVAKAKSFYAETLGLKVTETPMGLNIDLEGGGSVFMYPKDDHQPATFTVLNFKVDDIDAVVADLQAAGISLEQYEGMTDEKGVARGIKAQRGPDIAWFKDPAGNILSALQPE